MKPVKRTDIKQGKTQYFRWEKRNFTIEALLTRVPEAEAEALKEIHEMGAFPAIAPQRLKEIEDR